MAQAALRKCNEAGCTTLTRERSGRCQQHAKPSPRPDTRPNAGDRGYGADWRKVRAAKLRDNPLCEDCEDHGRTEAANEVHHLEKVADRPDLLLVMENLRSLCGLCHRRRTRRGE